MEIKTVPVDQIIPYDRNPRKNDDAVDTVAESIKQCGYRARIIVDENMVVLAGHTRLKALRKLGVDVCEVQVESDLSEDQKRKYRLLDNKTNEKSKWDFELLAEELEDLDFENFDFGFTLPDRNALDLDADADGDGQQIDPDIQVCHCPKCGFVFEVHK